MSLLWNTRFAAKIMVIPLFAAIASLRAKSEAEKLANAKKLSNHLALTSMSSKLTSIQK